MHASGEGFVVPVRPRGVLSLTGMFTQMQADAAVSSEGRLVGAWPGLWSITSVIATASTQDEGKKDGESE